MLLTGSVVFEKSATDELTSIVVKSSEKISEQGRGDGG